MSLDPQSVPINFSQGLDTKSDPFQVPMGKFLALSNSIFDKAGRLTKRNGYGTLTALPDNSSTYLTTFNGNLTAIGTSLQAYSAGGQSWVNKGAFQPVNLSVLPLIRSNTNQIQSDSTTSLNGLTCTVYTDSTGGAVTYKYAIADSTTGQNIVAPTLIPVASGTVTGSQKVFLLDKYFIIVFTNVITGTPHLQYVAISTTIPTQVSTNVNISTDYTPSTTVNFDGAVANNYLYLAWNGNDGGGAIRMTRISNHLVQSNTVIFAGRVATIMSVTVDATTSSPVIWASFYNLATTTGYTLAVDQQLNTILSPTAIIAAGTVNNITSTAQNMILSVYYEVATSYSYSSSIPGDTSNLTNLINTRNVTQAGVVGAITTLKRSVGLASKAFLIDGIAYLLAIYVSLSQPTYFLLDGSGNIVAKLAYSNGGGYYILGLPGASVVDTKAKISYLIKDLIGSVNKEQAEASPFGVYSQTGINNVEFDIGPQSGIVSAEIGNDLNLTGGYVYMYDGYSAVEQGFHVWPDHIGVTASPVGGLMSTQQYYYQVTYEWSDNQGNVFRSAPSIPVTVTTVAATSSVTIQVPTLRLTSKTANPVKIVIYRWSAAQQTYYQVTSITTPLLNSTTTDSVSFVDTQADASIIGNNIIYTTGGVIENIGPPAADTLTLFKSRLFLVDSEDKNLLWYSKQVIESTPVEMSDLFTIYVAPTTGAQGSTGPISALSALDDKLIVFKRDALYYITGTGPDNAGANNDFSEPNFISSTIGCENQHSIVFTPNGLMFQSDKGIWLLGRDLNTIYIGSPVEIFTANALVQSAVNVPGTNQVRFTLDSGITLVYDYFFGQWGSFINVPAISSTLYQNLHTYINVRGQVYQETPGSYLDGSNPVLMSFTTSWLNLAGLQGFERAYEFYFLGTFISPHKLSIGIAYDYNAAITQQSLISPDNYNGPYGTDTLYGGSTPYGGNPALEQWRIFFQQQKCQAFQITLSEMFDPQYGTVPGAGLTISGLDLTVGMKAGRPKLRASRQTG